MRANKEVYGQGEKDRQHHLWLSVHMFLSVRVE